MKLILLSLLLLSSNISVTNITEQYIVQKRKISPDNYTEHDNLQGKFISKFEHLVEQCGTEKEYLDLVKFSEVISGTSTLQYYSKVATFSIMKCPENIFTVLLTQPVIVVDKFITSLGIVPSPWEYGSAIYPTISSPKFEVLYIKYFKNWLHLCVDKKSNPIVYCGQEP